jgi:hypothetical protein
MGQGRQVRGHQAGLISAEYSVTFDTRTPTGCPTRVIRVASNRFARGPPEAKFVPQKKSSTQLENPWKSVLMASKTLNLIELSNLFTREGGRRFNPYSAHYSSRPRLNPRLQLASILNIISSLSNPATASASMTCTKLSAERSAQDR